MFADSKKQERDFQALQQKLAAEIGQRKEVEKKNADLAATIRKLAEDKIQANAASKKSDITASRAAENASTAADNASDAAIHQADITMEASQARSEEAKSLRLQNDAQLRSNYASQLVLIGVFATCLTTVVVQIGVAFLGFRASKSQAAIADQNARRDHQWAVETAEATRKALEGQKELAMQGQDSLLKIEKHTNSMVEVMRQSAFREGFHEGRGNPDPVPSSNPSVLPTP